jgi:hypothetical protein
MRIFKVKCPKCDFIYETRCIQCRGQSRCPKCGNFPNESNIINIDINRDK